MSSFGERFRSVFAGTKGKDIAEILEVSTSAVSNYMGGRLPDLPILLKIQEISGCDFHWLVIGEDRSPANGVLSVGSPVLNAKLRSIAHEQGRTVFADAEIAGPNREAKTVELLTEFLVARSLRAFNLIDSESEVMSKADHKRAQRFTFVGNIPQSLEDRIGEIVEKKMLGNSVSSVAQEQGIRDMIRELVQEEISRSTKRPFIEMDFGHADEEKEDAPIRKVA